MAGGSDNHGRAVVSLTFDDGARDQLRAAELLRHHGLKATFFVSSGLVGTSADYLDWAELTALQRESHEIGGHTAEHITLTEVPLAEATRQVREDRRALKGRGFAARSFAYPFGAWNAELRQMLAASGYNTARRAWGLSEHTGDGRPRAETRPPGDRFATLAAASFEADTTLAQMRSVVQGAEATRGWAQLIFHHVVDEGQRYATAPALLDEFLAWLALRREQGTQVLTVTEATPPGMRAWAAFGRARLRRH
jgi:peptidoglycan/xylan/chitin deacetylase (PgdA/CDA1 family)